MSKRIKISQEIQQEINTWIKQIAKQKKIDNPQGTAYGIDFETTKVLNYSQNKLAVCQDMIKKINKVYQKSSKPDQKKAFEILETNLLGKLFYLALQDQHYLIIKNFTNHQSKAETIEIIKSIESDEESALEVLEQIQDPELKEFYNGIVHYIY